jgi:pSer/pThr/pTyr-binding forkhead associated (FHA) protein
MGSLSAADGSTRPASSAPPVLEPPSAPAASSAPEPRFGGLFADSEPGRQPEPASGAGSSLFPDAQAPGPANEAVAAPPASQPQASRPPADPAPSIPSVLDDLPPPRTPSILQDPPQQSVAPEPPPIQPRSPLGEPEQAERPEQAPSLLRSETVSAFADPVSGAPAAEVNHPPSALSSSFADPDVTVRSEQPPQPDRSGSPDVAAAPRSPGDVQFDQAPGGRQQTPPGPGLTGGNPAIDPNSTLISDATLRVSVAGQDYSFLPGADVTIGRDPSCLIQLDERHSLVSRKHLRMNYQDNAWWLEDFSSKGTFVNGRRLKKPYKAEGAFVANLGDDDAGTPLRVITAGEHRVPRDKTTLIIAGLAVAALVPLVVLALLLTNNNSTSVDPDFETAKQSTVMLFGLDGGQGSGFFVSDNLILTNQHVSVLSPQLLVGVSRNADQPAQIEYATELVANHPFLDLSVLRVSNRVTRTAQGTEISSEPVGDIDLPAVTIGDSENVTLGDRVFNTGFPGRLSITSLDDAGELRLPSVVATSGEAANFAFWPGCSNPDADVYIPSDSPDGVRCSESGDLEHGVLLSSFFSSGQGASGSAVYHNNEVVAVVYAGTDGEDNANLGITTAIFSDWLEEIIAQNP